jgi:carbonic anhydrase
MKILNERLKKILENNQRWAAEKIAADPNYLKELSKGQHPKLLYIGCSDSRATAEELMGLKPGEIFVQRNIANLVVATDNNLNAVVQYALEQLKVKHIIVCGHYECGGVKAALYPSDLGQLNSWLQSLRDVVRLHQSELNKIRDDKKRFDRLVELNVREQCLNVLKIDHVQRSWYKRGLPKVHGWIFDVRTGLLKDLNIKPKELFSAIRAIYDLKPHETGGS